VLDNFASVMQWTGKFVAFLLLLLEGGLSQSCAPYDKTEDYLKAGESINFFGGDLIKQFRAAYPGKNIIFSPFSISNALAMISAGAAGKTLEELQTTLHLTDSYKNDYSSILSSLAAKNPNVTLNIANKVIVKNGVTVKPDFLSSLTQCFQGYESSGQFGSLEGMKKINKWVEDKTGGKIRNLLDPNKDYSGTSIMLINAVYFQAQWHHVFNELPEREFHSSEDNSVLIPFMELQEKLNVSLENSRTIVHIPYQGDRKAMFIVLPDKKEGVPYSDLTFGANKEDFEALNLDQLELQRVKLIMPKFKIESRFELKESLQNMGLTDAFTPRADFSGIADVPLEVSDITHKAFIEVNEMGSEAAAATSISMSMRSLVIEAPPKVILFNRPFSFFIKDMVTNVVLFQGDIVRPTY